MIRYGMRALGAQFRRGRSLFVLTTLGVALGIASVLSIQIINRSALGAFRGSMAAVSGDADLTIAPRTAALAESLYALTLADPAVEQAWPLYQVSVALAGRTGRHEAGRYAGRQQAGTGRHEAGPYYLDVVGVDFFAPVRMPVEPVAAGSITAALADSGWAAITPGLAAELGLRPGDTIPVTSGTRRARLRVGAIVDIQRAVPLASRKLVVMDIAQVQALLGERGRLTGIDLRLRDGADRDAAAACLRARLGPAIDVLTPAQREERAEGLTRAFRLNLSALSLISLVVGFFLVHTATQAALVRRRTEFGVLRATGATREQTLALILAEVGVLGLLGVAIGLPLGWLVAKANVGVVSQTISNLYLLGEIERLDVPLVLWLLAALTGLLGAGVGAVGPAVDLARTDVKELLAPISLHERTGRAGVPLMIAGVALVLGAGAWYWLLGQDWQPAGFVLAIALLLAIPLVTPAVLQALAGAVRIRGFGLGYSLRSLAARLQTTSFAIASLGIAVAMLVGITVMVGSFRETVAVWIGGTLRADVYVTTPSWRGTGAAGTLEDSIATRLAALPGVRSVDRLRGWQGYTGERRIGVIGVDFGLPEGEARFPLYAGDTESAFRAVRDSGAVIITEPLARKLALAVGDSIPLATPAGERRFRVAGISYDYSSENGGVAMDLLTLRDRFGPGPLNSVALYLAPGADPERAIDAIRATFPGVPLTLRSNRTLRAEVMRIFDQTFAVTRLLQVLALLVAASGITLTLLILARERRAELAVYRALGAHRRQVFRFFVGKGLGIGACGLGIGLAAGAALAAILIFVINRAYFGWTIQVAWPWQQLGVAALTILAAAVVASFYPAARASRTPATQLARDDL